MNRRLNPYYFVALLLSAWTMACNEKSEMPDITLPDPETSHEDLLRDSVYIYTYAYYLWQDQLPVSFPTRSYRSAEQVLEALKGIPKDGAGNLIDRYSFLDRSGLVRQEMQQGIAGNFGFEVRYNNDTDLYVKKVDPGSPAAASGLKRGWKLISINGNSNLNLTALEQNNFAFLDGAMNGRTIDLVMETPAGVRQTVRLQRASYPIRPILASHVFTEETRKIGYFAFDNFVSVFSINNLPTITKQQIDQLIAGFEQEGIRELIVDLRYNGGGAVETAEYLSSVLAPLAVHNTPMCSFIINQELIAEGWDQIEGWFKPVRFNKRNTLDLNRIYFLVTEATASASELLINNLFPHMEVILIGETKTYGKPVGFFGEDIMGVDLFAVSFQTLNSAGQGHYFDGIPVDKVVYDDLTKDFADSDEAMIKEALHHIRVGQFSPQSLMLTQSSRAARVFGVNSSMNKKLDLRGNKGMYEFRDKAKILGGRSLNFR